MLTEKTCSSCEGRRVKREPAEVKRIIKLLARFPTNEISPIFYLHLNMISYGNASLFHFGSQFAEAKRERSLVAKSRRLISLPFSRLFRAAVAILSLLSFLSRGWHDRRRVVHFNVTTDPCAEFVCQQLREAFPFDEAPRYLIRDNDGIYGAAVVRTIKALGIEEVKIAPHSPWQHPYVERLIGTIRRDLLNHVIVRNERHLRKLLSDYLRYYHEACCHMSLDHNAPDPREVEPPAKGNVFAEPMVGGLHHRYRRVS